jgi:hypothetical protein
MGFPLAGRPWAEGLGKLIFGASRHGQGETLLQSITKHDGMREMIQERIGAPHPPSLTATIGGAFWCGLIQGTL